MNEWVDFGLYSLQAVLLWIAMPGWGARFLRPVLAEQSDARAGGGGWMQALRAWGVLSVLVLLAARLRGAGWQSLLIASNAMLGLGILWASVGARSLWRRLKASASLPKQADEQALPLTRDDFLPRRLQHLVHGLLLLALVVRLAAGLIWPERVRDAWGGFLTGLLLALLLFFTAAGSVMRAPNHLDRVLGERYRRMEVRACYLLMALLALLQLAGLGVELAGLDSRRSGALLVTAFVSLMLGSFLLLFPRLRSPQ